MKRALHWLFETHRFTYWDLFAFVVGLVIGGWKGPALWVVLMLAGAYVAGLNKAWRNDTP